MEKDGQSGKCEELLGGVTGGGHASAHSGGGDDYENWHRKASIARAEGSGFRFQGPETGGKVGVEKGACLVKTPGGLADLLQAFSLCRALSEKTEGDVRGFR